VRLQHVAEQVRRVQLRYRRVEERVKCGWPVLDGALGGGFVRGAVHEFLAPVEGAVGQVLAWRVAVRALGRGVVSDRGIEGAPFKSSGTTESSDSEGRWLLYIDTQLDLYPPAVAQWRVPLGRLLVVRVGSLREALWVCEQALHCRALAAVILPVRTLDAHVSRRLQLAAEAAGGLGLLIRREGGGGASFAASSLQVVPHPGRAGVTRVEVTVLRVREGRPGEPLLLEWTDASDHVYSPAVSADGAGAARRRLGG
jgi:protein ImuA